MRGGGWSRAAALLIFVLTTTYTVLRVTGWPTGYVLGERMLDFKWLAWGPVRGLLNGYNVYDAHSPYVHLYQVGGAATAHTPASITILSPLAVLPLSVGAWVFFALSVLCFWLATWLFVRPTTPRQELAAAGAAGLVVCTGFGEQLLGLGNFQPVALLGLALVFRFPRGRRGVLGVVLLSFVPQTAVPLTVLLVRGRARTFVQGWLLALALSAPPVVLAGLAAGPGQLTRSLLDTFTSVVGNPNRVDVLGQLVGHETVLAAVALVVAAVGVACLHWEIGPSDLRKLVVATTLVTVIWYHEPTDLALLGALVLAAAVTCPTPVDVALGAWFAAMGAATSGLLMGALVTHGIDVASLWRLLVRLAAIGLLGGATASWWLQLRKTDPSAGSGDQRYERVNLPRASSDP
jgi:hypothetical protein